MNPLLYNDDCFNVFPKLEEKSIDLVLVDLPYGVTACKWDCLIDLDKMWVELRRICKKKCLYVFFCTTKFGVSLINSKPRWFKYDLVWEKSKKVGFLSANKMPLRKHEMIYVFGDNAGGKKNYNPQKILRDKPYDSYRPTPLRDLGVYGGKLKRINKIHTHNHPDSILQFEEKHEMIYVFGDNTGGKKTYNPQKVKGKPYIHKQTKQKDIYGVDNVETINNGDRHPTSIIKYKSYVDKRSGKIDRGVYREEGVKYNLTPQDNKGLYHPNTILQFKNPHKPVHRTQKPIKLCEWLIKSYTNEGDLVLDFTCGSGTTGLACINTKRRCILIEKDEDIFKIMKNRIKTV